MTKNSALVVPASSADQPQAALCFARQHYSTGLPVHYTFHKQNEVPRGPTVGTSTCRNYMSDTVVELRNKQ